jgi:hypothetical protein
MCQRQRMRKCVLLRVVVINWHSTGECYYERVCWAGISGKKEKGSNSIDETSVKLLEAF